MTFQMYAAMLAVLPLCMYTAGCDGGLRAKASMPATPAPVAAPSPPPPPKPVIAFQTAVELPASQPVPPESVPPRPVIATRPPERVYSAIGGEARPPVQMQGTAARATVQPPPGTAMAGASQAVSPPSPSANPAAAPAEVQDSPTEAPSAVPQELLSEEDRSTSRSEIENIWADVKKILGNVTGQPQTGRTKIAVSRIQSFLRLSEQSFARNDLRQAETLARRAQALARDLKRSP